MRKSNIIEHSGIVESIENNIVKINILSASACSSCHLKGACGAAETANKIIEVFNSGKNFSVGEQVNVIAEESLGFKALFYAYLLPFILVVSTLIITSFFSSSEAIIGFLSLIILIPYYAVLSFYKARFKKIFTFRLQKI
ncbi:MAG: SoxR reducing system RseC family protein [Bacteroidetes bacterium]|nr:SoxR reducing system RseC family protein [Bacteroidota bacterium]